MRFFYAALIIGTFAGLLMPALGKDYAAGLAPEGWLPDLASIDAMTDAERLDKLDDAIDYELKLQEQRRVVIDIIEGNGPKPQDIYEQRDKIKGWQKVARDTIKELIEPEPWTVGLLSGIDKKGFLQAIDDYEDKLLQRVENQKARIKKLQSKGIPVPQSYYNSLKEYKQWWHEMSSMVTKLLNPN